MIDNAYSRTRRYEELCNLYDGAGFFAEFKTKRLPCMGNLISIENGRVLKKLLDSQI